MQALRLHHWWLLCSLTLALPLAAAEPPLLWRIEGNPPSFLFGSIHSAHPALNRLPPSVEQALQASDAFYGELTFDRATLARVGALFQLPGDERLSDHLDAETRARVERVLQRINPAFSLAAFDRLKPWALATTLAVLEEQVQYPGQPVMDVRLYQRAAAQGKVTGGLETASEQAAVFEALDEGEQLALLKGTLAYIERAQQAGVPLMAETYGAYQQGEPARFLELLDDQLDISLLLKLKLERLLISERNRRMARRIDRLLQSQPDSGFFFAIGAAHYAGPHRLQKLLRERGYRVNRVSE